MKRLFGALALSALLAGLGSGTAYAEEPKRFGDAGQLVLSADRLLPIAGFSTQTVTANDGAVTTETTDRGGSFALFIGREPGLGAVHTIPRLAADFTVLPRLTVGASLALAFGLGDVHVERREAPGEPKTSREDRAPGSTILGFAPRLGYVLPLGANLALWGRAGLAFYSVKSSRNETTNGGVTTTSTETDTVFSLDLDPQLVWLPIPHVMVHVGPLVDIPLAGSHETAFTQGPDSKERSDDLSVFHVGLSAGLGAWFDL